MRWTPLARVSGNSMRPTLRPGDLVVTRPAGWGVRSGQVVVLTHPDPTGRPRRYVKRIAAVAGDTVEMAAGRVSVNGVAHDPGDAPEASYRATWTVPAGHVWVLGDNRAASSDSRVWERPFVPLDELEGVLVGPATRRRVPGGRPGRPARRGSRR